MKSYILKWRGTVNTQNIKANTLKEAKEQFCINENVVLDCIRQVQQVKKPSYTEL